MPVINVQLFGTVLNPTFIIDLNVLAVDTSMEVDVIGLNLFFQKPNYSKLWANLK